MPTKTSRAKTPKSNFYAVIMAGGKGERFWPVGRAARPKQFVSLFGGKPLIAHAVERLSGLVPQDRILIVTSKELVAATRDALPFLSEKQILGEPQARDTAAACATATAWVAWQGGDSATMCVLTADHLIADSEGFRKVLADAASVAGSQPVMSLVGIKPTSPATGYGYVELGAPFSKPDFPKGFRKVKRFVEKPNLGTAATYVSSGRFVWNSGMFVWRVSTFLDALREHCPKLADMALRLKDSFGSKNFERKFKAEYAALEKISVDYAVMEKASNLVAAKGSFGWDDVGTWASAGAHLQKDADGNAVHGSVCSLAASSNTVVNGQDGHVVALMGVEGLVVVHTPDATLVCTKEAAAGLKALVAKVASTPGGDAFV